MDERLLHLPPCLKLKGLCLSVQIQKYALNHLRGLEKKMNAQHRPDDQTGHEVDYQFYGFHVFLLQVQINHLHLKLFLFHQSETLQFRRVIFRGLHLDFLLKTRALSFPHYRRVEYLFLAQPCLSLSSRPQVSQRPQ